jgi:hypothetical protein
MAIPVIRVLMLADGTLNFAAGSPNSLLTAANWLRQDHLDGVTITVEIYPGLQYADDNRMIFKDKFALANFDVLMLFGSSDNGANLSLSQKFEIPAIEAAMKSGLGVFATGDHRGMGSALCSGLRRIRDMRSGWGNKKLPVPQVESDSKRIDTRWPADISHPASGDELDINAKLVWPRYLGRAAVLYETGVVHPLFAVDAQHDRAIRWLPDHAHEGICAATIEDAARLKDDFGGHDVEAVAWSVVPAGRAGSDLAMIALPRWTPTVSVHDGHKIKLGRVVVDSTMHHWVAGNLRALACNCAVARDVRNYQRNVVLWLAAEPVQKALDAHLVRVALDDPEVIDALSSGDYYAAGAELLRAMVSSSNASRADLALRALLKPSAAMPIELPGGGSVDLGELFGDNEAVNLAERLDPGLAMRLRLSLLGAYGKRIKVPGGIAEDQLVRTAIEDLKPSWKPLLSALGAYKSAQQ